jgi:hypothetical protein
MTERFAARRLVRTGIATVCVGLLLAALTVFVIVLDNYRTSRRAHELIESVRALRAGQSTMDDVQIIVTRFGATKTTGREIVSVCPDAEFAYGVQVANALGRWLEHTPALMRRFGLKPWRVQLQIVVSGGHACYVGLFVETWPNDTDHVVEASVNLLPVGGGPRWAGSSRYGFGTDVIRHYLHSIKVDLMPDALPQERDHAFDFNLSCLTELRGCRRPCQLMPSVWRDIVARGRLEKSLAFQGELAEDANDPVCRAIRDQE